MSEPTLTRRLRGARSTRRKDCQQCREPQIEKSDIFRRSTCRQSRNNTLKSLISYQASKIRVLNIVNIVNGAYIQHHFFPDSTYTLSQISGRQGSGPELTGVSAFSSRALPDPNERLLVVWPAIETLTGGHQEETKYPILNPRSQNDTNSTLFKLLKITK